MTPEQHAKAIEDAASWFAAADSMEETERALAELQSAILAGVGADLFVSDNKMVVAPDLVAELEEVKTVCAQAYQVVGNLLIDAGRFDSPEAEKILDNLAEQRLRHADVLPWESKAAPEGWQLVPVVPTQEMLSSVDDEASDKYVARGRAVSAWKSMLAAAPKP